jgi:hypothetical protein
VKSLARLALVAAAILAALPALADPRVYALVGAMGSRFEVVHEVESVGSNLPPFRREAYGVKENLLNRLALQGLDSMVQRLQPDSRRILLSTDPGKAGIEHVKAELRKLDRKGWDKILVALPAYRYLPKDGMPPRTTGLGLFAQSLCQSDTSIRPDRIGSCNSNIRPVHGPAAMTPKGEEIASNSFAAPFAFVEVWTLDPRTLEVLDKHASYGHRKLADERGRIDGIIDGSNKEFLASQIVLQVQESVAEAIAASLQGSVDVKEKGPVAR